MKVLSRSEVEELTGLSGTTLWRLERKDQFPPRRQISENRIGWLSDEVEEWLRTRPTVRPPEVEAA